MDDSTIQRIRGEVLAQLDAPSARTEGTDLEARVAALERAVSQLLGAPRPLALLPEGRRTHPSLTALELGPTGDRCVMEPDKPCVQSHACRVLGH